MPGLLALLVGFGTFLITIKFHFLFRRWSDAQLNGLYAVAALLFLWGLGQMVAAYFRPQSAQSSGGRTRHLRRFPQPGIIYLVIMMVLFVGAIIGQSNMLILVFALLTGPFVMNGWTTFSMVQRTALARRIPGNAMAGDPIGVEILLENRKRFLSSWLMSVTDRISGPGQTLEGRVLFARVGRKSRQRGVYQIQLFQRGRYTFGPLQVVTRFPLGLVERGLMFHQADEMLVYPRVGRLTSAWKRDNLLGSELSRHARSQRSVFDDEFHRIREFRHGDNPRDIHWRTSARHNALMVREYRPSRERHLLLLVDLWQPRDANDDARSRVELAVSLTATIGVQQMRESLDSRIHLALAGAQFFVWEAQSGPSTIEPFLEKLAVADAGPAPDSMRLLETLQEQRHRSTRTLLISTRPGAQRWLDELRREMTEIQLGDELGHIRVTEADPAAVAPFFQLA